MRDEPEPPSEADGGATWVASVRGTARGEAPRPGRGLWILRILRVIGFLAAAGLTVFGFFWTRSLDLDLGLGEGSPHLGFHGQRLPEAWICSEGHQHYSIPFWMGGLVLGLAAVALGAVQKRLERGRAGRVEQRGIAEGGSSARVRARLGVTAK